MEYLVSTQELPLSCPRPAETLWNAHPRVYLPIEETGEATCPYCGAKYKMHHSATVSGSGHA